MFHATVENSLDMQPMSFHVLPTSIFKADGFSRLATTEVTPFTNLGAEVASLQMWLGSGLSLYIPNQVAI